MAAGNLRESRPRGRPRQYGAFQRVEVLDLDVQVTMSSGFVAFTVVGLPDKAVGELRERVRAALNACSHGRPGDGGWLAAMVSSWATVADGRSISAASRFSWR